MIRTQAGAKVRIAFPSGVRFEVLGGVQITVSATAIKGPAKALEALPPMPGFAGISGQNRSTARAGAIRLRNDEAIQNRYPFNDAGHFAGRNGLRFDRVPEAAGYAVAVEDDDGNVVFELQTEKEFIAVPKGILKPGVRYYWRVSANGARGLRRGEAEFRTLTQDQIRSRVAWRAAETDAGMLAEIDRQLSLFYEARETLRIALHKAPQSQRLTYLLDRIEHEFHR